MSFTKPIIPPMRTAVPEIRSGQAIGDGFLPSVFASVTNAVNQLPILIFACWTIITGVGSLDKNLSVYTWLYRILYTKSQKLNRAKAFYKGLANVFFYLDQYVILVSCLSILFIPTLFKPGRNNIIVSSIFVSVFGIFYPDVNFFHCAVVGVAFYLYTQLRSPAHKMAVMAIAFAIIFVYFATTDVEIHASFTDNKTLDEAVLFRARRDVVEVLDHSTPPPPELPVTTTLPPPADKVKLPPGRRSSQP